MSNDFGKLLKEVSKQSGDPATPPAPGSEAAEALAKLKQALEGKKGAAETPAPTAEQPAKNR